MPSPKIPEPVEAVAPIVISTDTWASAADRFGVDTDALLAANGGPRPLIAGEELSLP